MKAIIFFIIFCLVCAMGVKPYLVLSETVGGNKAEIDTLNAEITERKDKIKQLEEAIGKYKKNIEQKQLEGVSLRNQIGILDDKLTKINIDIELTREKIKAIELEIEALVLSIQDKTALAEKQKTIITKIIKNLHANDQKNYLEILMTNDSFADFYDQAKYLENIYVDLGRSVKSLRLIRQELEDKRQQAEVRRFSYATLKNELEDKRKDLNEQTGVKQNLLLQTKASEMQYKTLLESLKKQYQVIEGEVRNYEEQIRKKLEAQDKIISDGEVSMSWPVVSHYITAYFHDPEYPYRRIFEHNAIDIRAAQGTPVKAVAAGYVGRAKSCTTAACYGYILLIHNSDLSTVYGHLNRIVVNEDDFVNRGDIIGYSGGTPGTAGAGPFVTGPHLHFEVRRNGIPVNPLNYLVQ